MFMYSTKRRGEGEGRREEGERRGRRRVYEKVPWVPSFGFLGDISVYEED